MSNGTLRGIAVAVFLFAGGCGSSSKGSGNDGGHTGESGGAGGGDVGGGTGGTYGGAFMPVAPCDTAAAYTAGDMVTFPNGDQSYSPKCLKVHVGDAVTFTTTSGDFSMHPMEASRHRGNTADTPITSTSSGTSRSFTFSTSGFFGYYCSVHGRLDDGTAMAGVIWVE
jgi:plastocyanin